MKKLVKIRLINWHTFVNNTIEITGNTLISGQTGSGKSTLIDAVQYVLTAGNAKFNKAASEKTVRTLEDYVRGKINLENKDYLRDGDVTSYICLEFEDNLTNRQDLIGVVIEAPTASKLNRLFFKLTNYPLTDDLFVVNGQIKTLREFKLNKDIEIFETKPNIEQMIKSVLGITKDKYFELINRALAFRAIFDINDFVNTFLLQENKINLENLYQNIKNVQDLQNIIEREESKVSELEKIEESYNHYLELEDDNDRLNYLKDKVIIDNKIQELKNLTKEKNDNLNKINLNNQEIKKLTLEKDRINEDIDLFNKSNSNKDIDLYQKLQKEIKDIDNKLNNIESTYESFFKNLAKEAKIYTPNNLNLITKDNHQDALAYLRKYQLKIENEKDKIRKDKIEYRDRREKLSPKLEKFKMKLESLSKNQFPYEPRLLTLQKTIKDELTKKYNQNIEIRPLCEYLDIKDEEWRMAIEGYLNNQRFDLIIEPKYFDDALEIYERIKKEEHIHGIGIVNTAKLKMEEVEENTLASLITSDNTYAYMYAIRILNHVVCTTLENLKKYNKSITKTCMTYRNHVARQISPSAYEDIFIGPRALKEQLEKYKKEYFESEELLKEIDKEITNLDNKYAKLLTSDITNLINNLDVLNIHDTLEKEKLEKENLIKKIKNSGLLFNLIEELNLKEDELTKVVSTLENYKNNNIRLEYQLEEIDNKYQELEIEKDNLLSNLKPKKNNWKIENLSISTIENKIKANEVEQAKLGTSIEGSLQKYNDTYQYDEIPNLENIKKYLDSLYNIRNQDLKKYRSDNIKLKESCIKSFKEDFLDNLRYLIEDAKNEIRYLNKALKDTKFGKEKYELTYTKSNDPELAKYYDIIVSGASYDNNSLFSEILTLEEQEDLDNLFNRLLSDDIDKTLNLLDEYTDYRRYMSYDVKVTNENNETYSFSKVSKGKSGGEIQTPFYVMIAASFEQLMKFSKRDNVGCVVMLDEAFNNMDSLRIEAMMEFYNNLNIQFLIAAPPEKTSAISYSVETNLIVITKNHKSMVVPIEDIKDE